MLLTCRSERVEYARRVAGAILRMNVGVEAVAWPCGEGARLRVRWGGVRWEAGVGDDGGWCVHPEEIAIAAGARVGDESWEFRGEWAKVGDGSSPEGDAVAIVSVLPEWRDAARELRVRVEAAYPPYSPPLIGGREYPEDTAAIAAVPGVVSVVPTPERYRSRWMHKSWDVVAGGGDIKLTVYKRGLRGQSRWVLDRERLLRQIDSDVTRAEREAVASIGDGEWDRLRDVIYGERGRAAVVTCPEDLAAGVAGVIARWGGIVDYQLQRLVSYRERAGRVFAYWDARRRAGRDPVDASGSGDLYVPESFGMAVPEEVLDRFAADDPHREVRAVAAVVVDGVNPLSASHTWYDTYMAALEAALCYQDSYRLAPMVRSPLTQEQGWDVYSYEHPGHAHRNIHAAARMLGLERDPAVATVDDVIAIRGR